MKDRLLVARRLREHVEDTSNPPILIFPEGTCINNTSVMQFKKGSFETGAVVYPVAIKVGEIFSWLSVELALPWSFCRFFRSLGSFFRTFSLCKP